MYNNANNNMNPLLSLLGGLMPGAGGQQGGGQQGGGHGQGQQANPLMDLLAAMLGGQNPMNSLNTFLPQAAQYMQNNRNGMDMEQFVRNEYQNRGIDINAAMQQLQEMMNSMNGGGHSGGSGGYGNNTYNNGGYNTHNTPPHGGNTNNTNNTNNNNNY